MIRSRVPIRIAAAAFLLVVAVSAPNSQQSASIKLSVERLAYPHAHTVEQIDEYHGQAIGDPYRWLEETERPESRAWIEAENRLTSSWLEGIPRRESIRQRFDELMDYERFGMPYRYGARYFYTKNEGMQDHSVLYWTESLDGEERVLLDPNLFSEDKTVALAQWVPSEDGRYLAYGVSDAGSDWTRWKVRDIDRGRDLSDLLEWVKFSKVAWNPDASGFYYSRYDEPDSAEIFAGTNYHQKLYFHRLNTPQTKDRLVYDRPDQKEWGFLPTISDDEAYLIISIWVGSKRENGVFIQDLRESNSGVTELLTAFDASYSFVGNLGPVLLFETDLDAPRGRLIAIDLRNPEREAWKELLPEGKEALRSARLLGNRLIASYLKDAHTIVRVFDTEGRFVREVDFPGLGTAYGFRGRPEDPETFYTFSGYTTPPTIYRYDVESGESRLYRAPQVDFDPTEYVTEQIFFHSKDGTRMPMFLSHRKGLELDGSNPTLLYGYGGFRASMTPYFSVSTLIWMEMGGIFAVPNIRGGGEYGKAWHDAGIKLEKQNTFDDFIAAAEWLIENGYTSTPKLAINGGSNGGLLVGACLVQRPNLFGAVIPDRGVLDMLRYDQFTIGWAWASDYGSPGDPEEFEALRAYSPLHNVQDGTSYPPTLILTGDHDDRVVPAHSFKFAARLQAAQSGAAPILIRIETRAGHGGGTPMGMKLEEMADTWAFLARVLEM